MEDDLVINMDDIEDTPVLTLSDSGGASNSGGGFELLMNDKQRKQLGGDTGSIQPSVTEIQDIETSLNDLSIETSEPVSNEKVKPSLFTISKEPDLDNTDSIKIGAATANTPVEWMGNDNAKIGINEMSMPPVEKSREELLKEKFTYLRRLEEIEAKGGKLTKHYSMDSSLEEMIGEYETVVAEKEQTNSVKFQGKMLMAAVTGLEYLNGKFDPFDVKLEGWAEQVHENITDYDEIFAELHEKYKSKAKMIPELKLLFQLGGSAIMLHMTNTMFKSAMPGMDDIMRQNPDLMQQFTQAAVNTMGQSNPGLGGFMSGMMPPPQQQSSGSTRPDVQAARGAPPAGVNLRDSFGNPNEPERTQRRPTPAASNQSRAEMQGPSDISDILSRMKTKTVEIQKPTNENSSTISLSELKEMSSRNLPRPNRARKPRSEKNAVALDL